jgi:AP2-like factor (ANT lineage)
MQLLILSFTTVSPVYLQDHLALLQGLMNTGSSSFVIENNGGYMGNGLSVASNSMSGNAVALADELALVNADCDMPFAGNGEWLGNSV